MKRKPIIIALVVLNVGLIVLVSLTLWGSWSTPPAYHIPEKLETRAARAIDFLVQGETQTTGEQEAVPSGSRFESGDPRARPPTMEPEPDEAWEKLSVNSRPLRAFFHLARHDKLNTSDLFRNRHLNPRDRRIPRRVRGQLRGVLSPVLCDIAQLGRVGIKTIQEQARFVVMSGQLKPYEGSITPEQRAAARKRQARRSGLAQRKITKLKSELLAADLQAAVRTRKEKQVASLRRLVAQTRKALEDPGYPPAVYPGRPGFLQVLTDKGCFYVNRSRLRSGKALEELEDYYFRTFVGTLANWFAGSGKTLTQSEASSMISRLLK